MKARALRAAAMLFGLSLLLTACDVGTVQEYLSDIMGGMPAASAGDVADDAADDDGEATDATSEASDTASSEAAEASADASDADGDDEGGDDDEAAAEGDDDSAAAARERCINRNEHVANLRSPERIREKRRGGEQREQADEDASQAPADDAGEEADDAGSDDDADDEAPAAPRDEPAPSPAPSSGGGGSGGGGGGDASDLSSVEQRVFDLLMAERERAGLEPLELDSSLSEGARGWSRRMATENFFSHDTSGNFAENIAYGYPTAAAVHDGWMDSDGHRRNRMNPGYSSYGIGVHKQGNTLYYTERFR